MCLVSCYQRQWSHISTTTDQRRWNILLRNNHKIFCYILLFMLDNSFFLVCYHFPGWVRHPRGHLVRRDALPHDSEDCLPPRGLHAEVCVCASGINHHYYNIIFQFQYLASLPRTNIIYSFFPSFLPFFLNSFPPPFHDCFPSFPGFSLPSSFLSFNFLYSPS